jgi:carbon monoxide dehydrogenase subunit G
VPTFSDEIAVDSERRAVWSYVKDVDNWAHLFPGYQRHLLVEDDHYFWQLRGETGAWSRLVEFDVRVKEWSDPDHVVFELDSRSEPVTGTGRFYTRTADGRGSIMGFELETHATGSAAPMINALLKRFVNEASAPFLRTLAVALSEHRDAADDSPSRTLPPGMPGVVIVEYRAPRTEAFDQWWRCTRLPKLRRDPYVHGFQRLEVAAGGNVVDYRELLESEDAAATLKSEHAFASECPDFELTRSPYAARRVDEDRPCRLVALARRFRRPARR